MPLDGLLRRVCESSRWPRCWTPGERNKHQHCKSTSTTAVPGSRRNDSVVGTDTCSFWLLQRWGLRRQRAITVLVTWILWSRFHFEVNKNNTVTVTKRGICSEVLFFLLSPFPQIFACIFFCFCFCSLHSWIWKSEHLLLFSHHEVAQLMYFSCSSCFMFPGVLTGSPRCEKKVYFYIYTYI